MPKRWRAPSAKSGELLVKYGKADGEEDIFYCWRGDPSMKRDTNLLLLAFNTIKVIDNNSLITELERRGYDITTLKFTIQKKVLPEG